MIRKKLTIRVRLPAYQYTTGRLPFQLILQFLKGTINDCNGNNGYDDHHPFLRLNQYVTLFV